MSNQLTINVNNKTDDEQSFQIFADVPAASGDIDQLWINVWGQAPDVDPKVGQTKFEITENFYALCGNAPSHLAKGLVVSTENPEPVNLTTTQVPGSDWRMVIPNRTGAAPVFDTTTGDTGDSTAAGGFTINTLNDAWIPADYPYAFVGIGRDDPSPTAAPDSVVPVAVWSPKPEQTYDITPSRVFYIAYGQTIPGLRANVKDFGKPVKIDFTGRSETTATVDLQRNYNWGAVEFK